MSRIESELKFGNRNRFYQNPFQWAEDEKDNKVKQDRALVSNKFTKKFDEVKSAESKSFKTDMPKKIVDSAKKLPGVVDAKGLEDKLPAILQTVIESKAGANFFDDRQLKYQDIVTKEFQKSLKLLEKTGEPFAQAALIATFKKNVNDQVTAESKRSEAADQKEISDRLEARRGDIAAASGIVDPDGVGKPAVNALLKHLAESMHKEYETQKTAAIDKQIKVLENANEDAVNKRNELQTLAINAEVKRIADSDQHTMQYPSMRAAFYKATPGAKIEEKDDEYAKWLLKNKDQITHRQGKYKIGGILGDSVRYGIDGSVKFLSTFPSDLSIRTAIKDCTYGMKPPRIQITGGSDYFRTKVYDIAREEGAEVGKYVNGQWIPMSPGDVSEIYAQRITDIDAREERRKQFREQSGNRTAQDLLKVESNQAELKSAQTAFKTVYDDKTIETKLNGVRAAAPLNAGAKTEALQQLKNLVDKQKQLIRDAQKELDCLTKLGNDDSGKKLGLMHSERVSVNEARGEGLSVFEGDRMGQIRTLRGQINGYAQQIYESLDAKDAKADEGLILELSNLSTDSLKGRDGKPLLNPQGNGYLPLAASSASVEYHQLDQNLSKAIVQYKKDVEEYNKAYAKSDGTNTLTDEYSAATARAGIPTP